MIPPIPDHGLWLRDWGSGWIIPSYPVRLTADIRKGKFTVQKAFNLNHFILQYAQFYMFISHIYLHHSQFL